MLRGKPCLEWYSSHQVYAPVSMVRTMAWPRASRGNACHESGGMVWSLSVS